MPTNWVVSVCSYLSDGEKRRLKFYTDQTMCMDGDKFESFISGRHMLKDLPLNDDQKDEAISCAKKISEFVNIIRDAMKPDLDTEFCNFKEKIKEEIDQGNYS